MAGQKEWTPRSIDVRGLPPHYDFADVIESGIRGPEFIQWIADHLMVGPPVWEGQKKKPKQKAKAKSKPPPASSPPVPSNVVALRKPVPEDEPLGAPPEFSEDGLAERFTQKYLNELLYCAAWKNWMVWAEGQWKIDTTLYGFDAARRVCKAAASEVIDRVDLGEKRFKISERLCSRSVMLNVESIAKTDRAHVVVPSEFDADPWSLNTPSGIIDLKTGNLRPARRDDFARKITAVGPGGKCPIWLNYLDEATQGDEELKGYLKRIAGYCLTGSITEHAFFFLYGSGGNGKGIYKDMLDWMLQDYARAANIDTFTEQRFSKHSSEIAYFQGARLVTSTEPDEGSRWAISRIKAMTGGDPITAAFKHQNEFTFYPLFKLLFTGNVKPSLKNVDRAIKRRLYLIPFEHDVPIEEQDGDLPEKIRNEGSGILSWMLEGCMEWQQTGLKPPYRVIASTNEYLESEDRIGTFLDEECIVDKSQRVKNALLYMRYHQWSDTGNEFTLSKKRFFESIRAKGFISLKSSGDNVVIGLAVK